MLKIALFTLFAPLFLALTASSAQALEPLRWGADVESGAPFAYKDPKDPSKVIGFEAEIIEALAHKMGREVEFVQNNWEGLVEGLKRHDYDIVANGLEITAEREEVVRFSTAYYITSEVLTVQRTNDLLTSLHDASNKRIGTLRGSLAERILEQQDSKIQVVGYGEEVNAFDDLAVGRIDGVFLDEPIALYYAKPNTRLKVISTPVGRMQYGIATRKDDREFSKEVNDALQQIIEDGTVRKILERWGLWNQQTSSTFGMSAIPETPATAYDEYVKMAFKEITWKDRLNRYVSFAPQLAKGAVMTLEISIISMILAIALGLGTALVRLYAPRPFAFLALSFVEIFRGTPLLIQLFLIFYGLPHIGIRLHPFAAAVLGLGLNYGASEAENYRAGILSIPKAQMDASLALGLSRIQSLRYVILPQAMRVVIPPVTNDFIALLKDSSLVSVITMVELTTVYGQLASTYFDYLGIGLLTAAVYFIIGLPFVRLSRYFERTMKSEYKTTASSGFARRFLPNRTSTPTVE